ncbi:MAG: cytochrome c [Candidatus Brocadiales bacterium]|nr:cytochrome c [Candidatus Brocadiales bacterium]
MRNISRVFIALFCSVVVTTGAITFGWDGSKVFGDENRVVASEDMHISKSTPTRSLMQLISAHTSKILDAIMVGDFHAVAREANAVAENSEIVMEIFFSADGKAGDWHKESGGDSKAASEMKTEFGKYLKITIDSSRNIAETAGKKDIVETYKSLDEMLQKACFACHAISRDPWPNWPDSMRQAGG